MKLPVTFFSNTAALTLLLIIFFASIAHLPAQSPAPVRITPTKSTTAEQVAEQIVRNTLNAENSYGWDTKYKGILINWRRPDPAQVQCSPGKCDAAGATTRHDPLNDVRTLQNLYWYKQRHPEDHSYDAAIARLLPTTRDRWGHSTLAKGYVYPVLLRLALYADSETERNAWATTLQGWAAANYKRLDPVMGVQHNRQGNCDCHAETIFLDDAYRVSAQVENGAALVDAGTRFNHPEWVAAGYREVKVVYSQAFSQEYHVFGRIYVISDAKYGKNMLWDTQATPWDVSEEVDLLLRAGLIVKDPEIHKFFLDLASQMLTAMRDLPFHDKVHGGFFGSFLIADGHDKQRKGEIQNSGREARQLSLLGTFSLANLTLTPRNQWADLEAEEYQMVTHDNNNAAQPGMHLPDTVAAPAPLVNGYPASTGGYMYELTPEFALVPHRQGTEDWISAEASNLALIGLQEWLADRIAVKHAKE
jgi:hypothetical protein